jgi:hypothetical protein
MFGKAQFRITVDGPPPASNLFVQSPSPPQEIRTADWLAVHEIPRFSLLTAISYTIVIF